MKTLAIIPARKGSKRLPGKNMLTLAGESLVARAIRTAKESKVFDEIVVSSDWLAVLAEARRMGVRDLKRPAEICVDTSHDFQFVEHALALYQGFDLFAILRPTSPFRTAYTIRRAVDRFLAHEWDSMRAVERTKHHPLKSWRLLEDAMLPFAFKEIPNQPLMMDDFPVYDLGTQMLGNVYCQNGCIHIARTECVKHGTVSGNVIGPFFTEGYEGLDINTRDDLEFAEWLIERGKVE